MRPYAYRDDPRVPDFPDDRPLIIFDGKCVLCSRFARFVMRHDKEKLFRLAAAQSPLGEGLFRHLGLSVTDYESNILLEKGVAYLKSESSIRIIARLGFPWSLILLWRVLPRGTRDAMYDFIARNRLKWMGAREVCYAPQPDERERFLS